MSTTIAITAANGQLGRLIIDGLKAKLPAEHIVALVRSPAKATNLGVAVREADYSKPEMLAQALTGINTLLLISGNEVGQRTAQHQNVIQAAKTAGVKRIVYTSGLHADHTSVPLAIEHFKTEEILKASGISFTILRNGWYTENLIPAIRASLAHGTLPGSTGEGRFSAASRSDYAEAAVKVLTNEGHAGKTYELAGDTSFTMTELADEVSRQAGKTITYSNLSQADYADALIRAGLPESAARTKAAIDVIISQNFLFEDGRALSTLIGHPTTPISVAVTAALK